MINSQTVMYEITEFLKNNRKLSDSYANKKLNGNYFSGIDIVLKKKEVEKTFRIIVIEQRT